MFRPIHPLTVAVTTAVLVAGCAGSDAPRATAAEVPDVCAGISVEQARATLAAMGKDVDGVDVVREESTAKPFALRTVGADIHIRAEPGWTTPWLGRVVACHAMSEVAGAPCTGAECPLDLAGVTTGVSATGTGFTLAIRSDDYDVAREIVRRSQRLLDPPPIASASMAH